MTVTVLATDSVRISSPRINSLVLKLQSIDRICVDLCSISKGITRFQGQDSGAQQKRKRERRETQRLT